MCISQTGDAEPVPAAKKRLLQEKDSCRNESGSRSAMAGDAALVPAAKKRLLLHEKTSSSNESGSRSAMSEQ